MKPVTIERTSRAVKAHMAGATVLLGVALYVLFAEHSIVGGWLFWIALLWMALARVARWWLNG